MNAPGKYVYKVLLLSVLLITTAKTMAQEICNNGIDDDGDGLADLFDPDCQCRYSVPGNMLQNGSFELYDHCPTTYLYSTDHSIATGWEFGTYTNINEAYFYHNLDCSFDSAYVTQNMAPAQPLPDGRGFISIQNISAVGTVNEKEITKTYVSQCLQTPLKKGESYTVSFYAGRFRSWDNYDGKIFPFNVAIFGNADCNAVPFGQQYVLGNGCPANYPGWIFLGETTVYSSGQWAQAKITFTPTADINVVEIGPDCTILPPVADLSDSTTFLDFHVYYLDAMQLLPTQNFNFQYVQTKVGIDCNGLPVLEAPAFSNGNYQWYKDSLAIKGATSTSFQVTDTAGINYYNVEITTPDSCIISEPIMITSSKLENIKIPTDTFFCENDTLLLAQKYNGITYTVNGLTSSSVMINKEGNYTIVATDVYGCQKIFTTNVTQQNCADCEAFIPSAFTPNGDGLNDLFKPKFFCYITQFHFRIFNRWGRVIFESNDINKGWDGFYVGNKLPSGSYVYYIDYKTSTGTVKTAKGLVTIIL